MPLSSEIVTLAGSGLVFSNSYDASVSPAYRAAILAAENDLQSHFTDAVTLSVNFTLLPLPDGAGGINLFYTTNVSYAAFTAALTAHATTADDRLATASFPATDPTNGAGFTIPIGYARMLGLSSDTSHVFDDSVVLNANVAWTFGQDAVATIEHEITEGGMGRIASLARDSSGFGPLDLFRFTATGQHDYTGGADGVETYFGVDGTHVTSLNFHNAISASGANDGDDLGDWEDTFVDAFGPSFPGFPASMSLTDLRVMDVIGWTPATAIVAPPDDYADNLSDSTHPIGALAVGGSATGALQTVGDRDWFKVTLTAGNTYTISEVGQRGGGGTLVDSYLRLRDANGALVAQNDDASVIGSDSQIVFAVTASGTYYVEAGAYADDGTGTYRLNLTSVPTPPDDFANSLTDTLHPFGAVSATGSATGMLEAPGDRDWFAVTLTGGTNYAISLTGQHGGGGTLVDPILRLHDATGQVVGYSDDISYPENSDSRLVFQAGATGTYYVEAGAFADQASGSYTVSVTTGGAPTAGDDVLVGAPGGDTVQGLAGNDTVIGGNGPNYLRGNDGDDSIQGGAGFDDINGNKGNDTIDGGGGGGDWLVGGQGDDLIIAHHGGNILYGNLGNDTLIGGDGVEILRGGQGDDSIQGGGGNDYISGDRGNDTVSGGAGADIFHGSQDAGIDKVLDFNLAEGDRVMLDPGTTYTVSQQGADTVIDMGGGNQMILVGVQLSTLTAGWIFEG